MGRLGMVSGRASRLVVEFRPRSSGRTAELDRWPRAETLGAVLLALGFIAPGLAEIEGAPGWTEALFDFGAVALFAYGLVLLLARRIPLAVPTLALLYLLIVVAGLLTAPDPTAAIVSLRNFTLLPATALVLALNGWSERGTRLAMTLLVALCAVEFAVTIVQYYSVDDVDLIDGTMGDYNGWVVAFTLLYACGVAVARFLFAGRREWYWLLIAAVLPLFAIWALVKVVVVLIPVAFGATIVAYLLFRSDRDWRRAGMAALAGLLSLAAILGDYAHNGQLDVFTDSRARNSYLRDAQLYEQPVVPSQGGGSGGSGGSGKSAPKPKTQVLQTPGRQTQWKNAVEIAEESPRTEAVGHGLGAATYAESLGVDPPSDPKVLFASLNSFGTLVIERGWLGVVVVGICALALGLMALRLLPRAAGNDWRSAVLLAYPAVVLLTIAGGFYASPFQEPATEVTFWLLTSIVLSLALTQRRADRGGARSRVAAEPPR
jgi:hypothetical protein